MWAAFSWLLPPKWWKVMEIALFGWIPPIFMKIGENWWKSHFSPPNRTFGARGLKTPKKPLVRARGGFGSKGVRTGQLVYKPRKKLSRSERKEMLEYGRRLRFYLRKGWTLAFKKILRKKRVKYLFHPVQHDQARGRLAAGYFAAGRDQWALNWAKMATKQSGKYLPEAQWIAGLAAYGKASGLVRVQKLLNLTKLLCYTK